MESRGLFPQVSCWWGHCQSLFQHKGFFWKCMFMHTYTHTHIHIRGTGMRVQACTSPGTTRQHARTPGYPQKGVHVLTHTHPDKARLNPRTKLTSICRHRSSSEEPPRRLQVKQAIQKIGRDAIQAEGLWQPPCSSHSPLGSKQYQHW